MEICCLYAEHYWSNHWTDAMKWKGILVPCEMGWHRGGGVPSWHRIEPHKESVFFESYFQKCISVPLLAGIEAQSNFRFIIRNWFFGFVWLRALVGACLMIGNLSQGDRTEKVTKLSILQLRVINPGNDWRREVDGLEKLISEFAVLPA